MLSLPLIKIAESIKPIISYLYDRRLPFAMKVVSRLLQVHVKLSRATAKCEIYRIVLTRAMWSSNSMQR